MKNELKTNKQSVTQQQTNKQTNTEGNVNACVQFFFLFHRASMTSRSNEEESRERTIEEGQNENRDRFVHEERNLIIHF